MSSTENNAEVAVEKQVDLPEEVKEKSDAKGAKRPAEVCTNFLHIFKSSFSFRIFGIFSRENFTIKFIL